MATRIQMKLKAATFGITVGTGTKLEELLKLYDNTGDGELDQRELTRLIRKHFNIGAHELPDAMIGEPVMTTTAARRSARPSSPTSSSAACTRSTRSRPSA